MTVDVWKQFQFLIQSEMHMDEMLFTSTQGLNLYGRYPQQYIAFTTQVRTDFSLYQTCWSS